VAAALVGKAKTVTVVDQTEAPFQLALGKEVGNAIRKVCQCDAVAAAAAAVVDVVDCTRALQCASSQFSWFVDRLHCWMAVSCT